MVGLGVPAWKGRGGCCAAGAEGGVHRGGTRGASGCTVRTLCTPRRPAYRAEGAFDRARGICAVRKNCRRDGIVQQAASTSTPATNDGFHVAAKLALQPQRAPIGALKGWTAGFCCRVAQGCGLSPKQQDRLGRDTSFQPKQAQETMQRQRPFQQPLSPTCREAAGRRWHRLRCRPQSPRPRSCPPPSSASCEVPPACPTSCPWRGQTPTGSRRHRARRHWDPSSAAPAPGTPWRAGARKPTLISAFPSTLPWSGLAGGAEGPAQLRLGAGRSLAGGAGPQGSKLKCEGPPRPQSPIISYVDTTLQCVRGLEIASWGPASPSCMGLVRWASPAKKGGSRAWHGDQTPHVMRPTRYGDRHWMQWGPSNAVHGGTSWTDICTKFGIGVDTMLEPAWG